MDLEEVDGLTSRLYQTLASASTSVFCFSFLSGKRIPIIFFGIFIY